MDTSQNFFFNDSQLIEFRKNIDNYISITHNLDFMKKLDTRILQKWIEFETQDTPYYTRVVHLSCLHGLNTGFIIWLIDTGFQPHYLDTQYLANDGNILLLQFYHHKGIPMSFETFTNSIATGRLEILDWLYKIGADNQPFFNNKLFMNNAFYFQQPEILHYLKHTHALEFYLDKPFYQYFESTFTSRIPLKHTVLSWLWNNGYKWTQQDAHTYNNPFMLSYFK